MNIKNQVEKSLDFTRVSRNPSIKMNINGSDNREKSNAFFAANMAVTVVVEQSVIDSFGGSAFVESELPLFRAASNAGKQSQIPRGFSVNGSAIFRWRTRGANMGSLNFTGMTRTAPLDTAPVGTKPPVAHFVPCLADGYAVTIDRDMRRVGEVAGISGIKRNDSVDVPTVKQLVSGLIIACGVRDE